MAVDGSLNGATGIYSAIGHGIARLLPLTDNLGGGARLGQSRSALHIGHTHPVANEWKRNTKRSGKSGTRRFGTATGSESPCDTEGHEKTDALATMGADMENASRAEWLASDLQAGREKAKSNERYAVLSHS